MVNDPPRTSATMLYDHAVFDTTFATAVQNDPALIAELQRAFLESMHRSARMAASGGDTAQWAGAALHLQRLAGSVAMPGLDAAVRETLLGSAPADRADLAD